MGSLLKLAFLLCWGGRVSGGGGVVFSFWDDFAVESGAIGF